MEITLPLPIVAALTSAIISAIVAFITIRITKNNVKKQIRVSKLEEILEILTFYTGYYNALFWLTTDTEKILKTVPYPKDEAERLQKKIKSFAEHIGEDTFQKKHSRLVVLANSYIPNSLKGAKLKTKVLGLSDMIMNMYMMMIRFDNVAMKIHYKEGYAKPGNMQRFVRQLEDELIIEMDLGHRGIKAEVMREYLSGQFKRDIGIIN